MLLWSVINDVCESCIIAQCVLLALTCRRYIENFLAFGAILFAKMYLHYCTSIKTQLLFTQIANTMRLYSLRTSHLLNNNSSLTTTMQITFARLLLTTTSQGGLLLINLFYNDNKY